MGNKEFAVAEKSTRKIKTGLFWYAPQKLDTFGGAYQFAVFFLAFLYKLNNTNIVFR
jgi:hypothetical protein